MAEANRTRRALVTGAGRGIGRELGRGLAERCEAIALVGRSREHLQEAATAIESIGCRTAVITADLARPDEAARAVAEALASLGHVDILVNNAGTAVRAPVLDLPPDALAATFALNVHAPLELARHLAPQMMQRGWGRIVNISSPYAQRPSAGLASYCISKAALDMVTRCLALELAGTGVTVNGIAPIQVLTDLSRATFEDPERRRLVDSQIPAGRWAEPEDVAAALLYLVSEGAGMVTGHTLAVDGGRLLI